ncbi:hypothetical protein V6N11_081294 [Hibiscus sabdariffa]|uniref:Uncharacterized protein n=1 Tax=Hibiscus sabdariffa TaxID=183260 RepID=A0ABR2QJL0_9ROSI
MISSSLHYRHRAIARRRSSELTGELRPPPISSPPMLSPSHLGFSRMTPKCNNEALDPLRRHYRFGVHSDEPKSLATLSLPSLSISHIRL